MEKMCLFAVLAAMSMSALAAEPISIVPQPVQLKEGQGSFTFAPAAAVLFEKGNAEAQTNAEFAAQTLRPATGFAWPVREAAAPEAGSLFFGVTNAPINLGKEGYELTADAQGVRILAQGSAGLFYGLQTLRQLLPAAIFKSTKTDGVTWSVPCVTVTDWPRFAWRGLHLDTCRYFLPKSFVLKYIDLIALHKMNSFHWHLTDDQGWRIEIKKYPKLTEVGAWREQTLVGHYSENVKSPKYDGKRHGGFYSQEDIREVVAYAAARHINVVPEIEMPGHAQAAIAAYPELGVTGKPLPVKTEWGVNENVFNVEENTVKFLQDVLTEVMGLFPSPYIHVGGDECPKKQWKESKQVQARMKELNIETEDALQSWFVHRMDTFLTEHGRRLLGWDEILEGGLAPGAVVMSWRGIEGGITAAKAGHDVVMAPTTHTYLDYYQSKDKDKEPLAIGGYLPLDTVYNFEPIPDALNADQAKHILGAQGQVWTEYISTPEYAEYMAFPRACAVAELVWTPKESKNYSGFVQRLGKHYQRFAALGVNARKLD